MLLLGECSGSSFVCLREGLRLGPPHLSSAPRRQMLNDFIHYQRSRLMPQSNTNWRTSRSLLLLIVPTLILALIFLPTLRSRLTLLTAHLRPTPLKSPSLAHSAASTLRNMTSSDYEKELHIALLAVQRATLLTKSVFHTTAKGTLSKSDHAPVTIGDFGAQALRT